MSLWDILEFVEFQYYQTVGVQLHNGATIRPQAFMSCSWWSWDCNYSPKGTETEKMLGGNHHFRLLREFWDPYIYIYIYPLFPLCFFTSCRFSIFSWQRWRTCGALYFSGPAADSLQTSWQMPTRHGWCQACMREEHLNSNLGMFFHWGLVNVPIEHHPSIGDIISNRYLKVMSNIPKMGHLTTPV